MNIGLYTQVTFQSRWAGLKALYAALTVVALEPLKLPTAALPKAFFSPAEFCILKLLGYMLIGARARSQQSCSFKYAGDCRIRKEVYLISADSHQETDTDQAPTKAPSALAALPNLLLRL